MVDITQLLANAAQTNADFNFGKLNKSYWEGLDEAYKRRNQDAFLNIQNDPSLQDVSGNPDPTKLFMRQLQVGGTSAAKSADELGVGADRLGGYRAADELERRLRGTNLGPPSLNRSAPAPSRAPGPTSYADPNENPQSAAPPGPKQATLKDVFAASGIAPSAKNYSDASAAIQLATKQPFDPNGPLDLNNPMIRMAIAPFVRSQQPTQPAPQPQPQAVGSDPQVQSVPGSGVPLSMQLANQAVPGRFPTPQQGGQPAPPPQVGPSAIQQQFPAAAAPPGPQTMMLSPEASNAMAQAQPQPQQSVGIDPESLRQMIPSDILRAGGGTVAGTLNLLSQIKNSRVPADRKAGYVKLYDDLTKQLELTDQQRNAQTSGLLSAHERAQTTAKQDAELYAKKYQAITDQGDKSRGEIPQLELLQGAMDDKHFFSGTGEKYALLYNRLKSAVGIDPNAAVPQELLRKVTASNVLSSLGQLKGLGPIRVPEMNMAREAAASPENSVPANKLLVEISKRTHQRYAEIADMAQEYKSNHGTLDAGFDKAVSNHMKQKPLFTDAEIKNWHTIIGADKAKSESGQVLRHPQNGRAIAPNPDPKTNKTNPYIYVD